MFNVILMTIKVSIVLWVASMVFARLIKREDAAWIKGKPTWIMIGLFVIGMNAHNVWIMYIVFALTLPVLARNRGEAAALFVVTIGAMPDLATYLRVGSTSIMTIDKWVFVSLGFVWVLLRMPKSGLRFSGRFDLPFLLLLGTEFVQARGLNVTSTIRSLLATILTMGLPYLVLTRSITKVEHLRKVMLALAYLGFVLGVEAVYESRAHFFPYIQVYDQLHVAGSGYRQMKLRGGMYRSIATFGDATVFSLAMVLMLMAVMVSKESFRSTSKYAGALAVVSLGIFVTSSRNALIAAVIGMLAFDLYRRKYTALFGKTSLLGMGYAVVLLLAEVSPYFKTMTGNAGDTSSTAEYRRLLLTRGIEEFRKHPLAGTDLQTIVTSMHDMVQGEGIIDFVNGYLFYSLVCGVGGLIAMVMAFVLPMWAMLRARRAMVIQGQLVQRSAAFVFATGMILLITTAFTGFGGRGSTLFYLAMGIGGVLYAWRKISPELLAATDRPVFIRGKGMVTLKPLTPERPVRGRHGPRRSRALALSSQSGPA